MPAKSKKQQRYMGMCAHMDNPPASCPSKKVAREFSFKPKGGYRKRKRKGEGMPRKDKNGFY
jgi:hypothetical protein